MSTVLPNLLDALADAVASAADGLVRGWKGATLCQPPVSSGTPRG